MIVLDTSGLYALLDARDPGHEAATTEASAAGAPFVIPAASLGEAAYLVESRLGGAAWRTVLADIERGAYLVEWRPADTGLVREVLERMPEAGYVDAAVAVSATRLRAPALSFDRRHFIPLAGLLRFELRPMP